MWPTCVRPYKLFRTLIYPYHFCFKQILNFDPNLISFIKDTRIPYKQESRENQFYQFKIGMLDKDEWNAMLISFKTLFKEPKHLEIWEFIKITFAEDFVELVDEQIKQSKLYG